MNLNKTYLIIGAVIVVGIVIALLIIPEDSPQSAQGMPAGHPDVGAMQGEMGDTPNRTNVRSEFMERLSALRKRIAAAPETDTSDVFVLARMLSDGHQMAEALPLYERYALAAPRNIEVLLELANVYYELEAFQKSLNTMQSILKIEPKHEMAMYNMGAILLSMEKKPDAKRAWQDFLETHPESQLAGNAREMIEQL